MPGRRGSRAGRVIDMSRRTERMILALVASFLKKLTDRDIDALIDGRARLVVEHTDPPANSKDASDLDAENRLGEVARVLQSALSRDEANDILNSSNLRAAELRKLMRIMDLPVSRTDTVEKLHYKLIDSTVGFRLRSDAVRGNETKPGGSPPPTNRVTDLHSRHTNE